MEGFAREVRELGDDGRGFMRARMGDTMMTAMQ
jgi:hypothetical protein